MKKEGTVVHVGVYPGPIETNLNEVMMKELKLIGTYGYIWTTWQRIVQLLSEHRVEIDPLISHEFPLCRFEEAFRVTQDGLAIKVIFTSESEQREAGKQM